MNKKLIALFVLSFVSAQVMASGKNGNESPDHHLEYLRRCMNRGLMDQEREIQAGMWDEDYDGPWYAYVDGVAQYDKSWVKKENKKVVPILEQLNQSSSQASEAAFHVVANLATQATEKKSEVRTMRFPELYDSIEEEDAVESMNVRTSARLSGTETLSQMMDRDRCEGTHDAEKMVYEMTVRAHLDLTQAYIDRVNAEKNQMEDDK